MRTSYQKLSETFQEAVLIKKLGHREVADLPVEFSLDQDNQQKYHRSGPNGDRQIQG